MEQRLRLGARTPIKGISFVFKDTSKCRSFWSVISDLPEWSGFFASFREKRSASNFPRLMKAYSTSSQASPLTDSNNQALWRSYSSRQASLQRHLFRRWICQVSTNTMLPVFESNLLIRAGPRFFKRAVSNFPWYFPLLKQFKTPISKSSVQQPRASWWPHTSLPSPSEFQFRDFRGKLCAWSDTIFITLRRKHLHSHESLVPKIRRATTRISRDQRSSHHGPPFWEVSRVF
jgi:hypothetical protein